VSSDIAKKPPAARTGLVTAYVVSTGAPATRA
jgi:hypothetical protein